jgi:hypothetical protein
MPVIDHQRAQLLDDMAEWSTRNAAQGLGRLPLDLDIDTLEAINTIIQTGIGLKDDRGIPRPTPIAPVLAWRIVEALRAHWGLPGLPL